MENANERSQKSVQEVGFDNKMVAIVHKEVIFSGRSR